MSEEKKRKQLRILPEVLPEPTQPGASSPRQRTLSTMQRLLALAATGALLQTGCSKGPTPDAPQGDASSSGTPKTTNTTPPLDATPDAATPDAATTIGSGTSASVPPQTISSPTRTPPPPNNKGYRVVDPIPNPARIPKNKSGL